MFVMMSYSQFLRLCHKLLLITVLAVKDRIQFRCHFKNYVFVKKLDVIYKILGAKILAPN